MRHPIHTRRLTLEPLRIAHAKPLFAELRREVIYRYIDERPPRSLNALMARYRVLGRGRSPRNRAERWLNWAIRLREDRRYVGYVQATVLPKGDAYVGYVIAPRWWGRGLGREAVAAMLSRLAARGVRRFIATVEADNARSVALLERLRFEDAPGRRPGERTLVLSVAGAAGDNRGKARSGGS